MNLPTLIMDSIALVSLAIIFVYLILNRKYEEKQHTLNSLHISLGLLVLYALILVLNNLIHYNLKLIAELIILPLAMILLLVFTFVSRETLLPHEPDQPAELS